MSRNLQGDSHRILRASLNADRCFRRNTKRKFVKNAKTAGAILFLLSAFLLSPPAQGAWIEMPEIMLTPNEALPEGNTASRELAFLNGTFSELD